MDLEPAIRNELVELICRNFRPREIEELGKLILRKYESNELSGTPKHVSLGSHKAAALLVNRCAESRKTEELVKLVVELDGAAIHGRKIRLDGVERLLGSLTKNGCHYDFRQRRLVSSCRDPEALVDWGCLRDGREYEVTIASLDIAGSSALVRAHGLRRMEQVYLRLWNHLRERLGALDGRIWSWAGDGGIAAFVFDGHVARATRFALEVQRTLPVFNAAMDDHLPADIALRIGLDTGRVRFAAEPGKIVSDVINYAAHLEKQAAPPGAVAVSQAVHDALPPRLAACFSTAGRFEDRVWFVASEAFAAHPVRVAVGGGRAACRRRIPSPARSRPRPFDRIHG
jgi:class 3 adenylate cyclase